MNRGPRRRETGLAALLAVLCAVGAGAAVAGNIAGTPRVIDGDSMEVDGVRIRLYGIDAPEPQQRCRDDGRPYPCGTVATAALKDLTAGVALVCKPEGETSGGELPATCFAEGYDVGENMVYTGWALADRRESRRYVTTEQGAKDAGRGLWRGRFVEPRAWRAGKRLPEG